MSLTAFNRLRRMKQVEAMKPENIVKKEEPIVSVEEKIDNNINEKPILENVEKEERIKPSTPSRRRTTKK